MSARAASGPTLESLIAGWEKGTFHPVYLFAGGDTLGKEEAVKRFQSKFLGGAEADLSVDRFEGETATAGQILNALRTFSLLGDRRLVLVRRAHDLPPSETNALSDGLKDPPAGNCLILLWDERADDRHALVQAARSAGVSLMFWVPFENQMPRWVQDRARTLGKGMTYDAAQGLVDVVGPNLADLAQELEKLSLYVKERNTIEAADVEAIRPDNRTLHFFEFDRAIWTKDFEKALTLLEVVRTQGQEDIEVIGQLARIYRKVLYAKALLAEKKCTIDELWAHVRIKTRDPQRDFQAALAGHSWDELIGALEAILRTERDLKTGRAEGPAALTLLLHRLTGKV